MPKRSETRPSKTLKIVFPCTREHSFHFRHATLKLLILSSFLASLGIPLPPFIEIFGVFLGGVFSGPDLWVNSDIRRSPGVRLEDPGESF